jgi:hypothetical protein
MVIRRYVVSHLTARSDGRKGPALLRSGLEFLVETRTACEKVTSYTELDCVCCVSADGGSKGFDFSLDRDRQLQWVIPIWLDRRAKSAARSPPHDIGIGSTI